MSSQHKCLSNTDSKGLESKEGERRHLCCNNAGNRSPSLDFNPNNEFASEDIGSFRHISTIGNMDSTNQTIKKRAAIYCRVSTKEQVDEGNSLTTQESICKEYAFSHDFDIVETYREQGESAKNRRSYRIAKTAHILLK